MGVLIRALWVVPMLGGCVPGFDTELDAIDAPTILAVRAEPAEVAPGQPAQLTALVASPDGVVEDAPLDWAYCVARRPLAELGPVATACLAERGDALDPIGTGPQVQAPTPTDGCRLFGPDPPPAEPGQPAGRVVEPDITGGYYQPVRILGDDVRTALFGLRISCGLAGATQRIAAEFRQRYKANVAPATLVVERVRVGEAAEPIDLQAGLEVPANAEVELRVGWTACASAPSCGDQACTLDEDATSCPDDCTPLDGCSGAETYLYFDPVALRLTTRRESISVAWLRTLGDFEIAQTGRASDDDEPSSTNLWIAPAEPGEGSLFIVLRDDRGGASWVRIPVLVTG